MGGNNLGNQADMKVEPNFMMNLRAINPKDLRNNPEALYAYNQAMAQSKINSGFFKGKESGQESLPTTILQHNREILKKYFPTIQF